MGPVNDIDPRWFEGSDGQRLELRGEPFEPEQWQLDHFIELLAELCIEKLSQAAAQISESDQQ